MKNFKTKNKLSQSFCDFPHISFAESGIKRESTLSTCSQDPTNIRTEEVMVTNSLFKNNATDLIIGDLDVL